MYRDVCREFVCFGDSDWWYHNRGHMDMQLMRRYAEFATVLYVNSVVMRKFNIKEGTMFLRRLKRKLGSITHGVKPAGIGNMSIYTPLTMPVHHIGIARELNALALKLQVHHCMRKLDMKKPIIWVACPAAAQAAVKLPHTGLVYQRSDRYEDLPGVDTGRIKLYDRLLKEHADLVIYVNRKLMAEEKDECRKAIFLDHGVDYEMFANAHKDRYIPEEMKRIPHPVLGFYGGIDSHTVDILLIESLADLLKDISIVLIGDSSVDLSGLAGRDNVFLLGRKPYAQLPHYAKCFDVCFMPWRQNGWIEACNPIKLKEYLALGKPVISTPFKELENYERVVKVTSDAGSFAKAVRQACEENDLELASGRRDLISGSTWDVKAEEVLKRLCRIN